MNKQDVKIYFDWLDAQVKKDGKITREDLEKSVSVDLDNSGIAGDTSQELELIRKNVEEWITNAGDKWSDDQALDYEELCDMLLN